MPTGDLASPFGELMELAEQAEPQEWGSEEQLKRYLRTGPVGTRARSAMEARIRRILRGRKPPERGPGTSKTPASFPLARV